jgi:hypothetical protein
MTGPLAIIAAAVLIVAALWILPRPAVPAVIAVASAITVIALVRSVLMPGRPEPVEVIAAAVRDEGPVPRVCACGAFARSLNFYTHLPTVVAATDPEVIGFLSSPDRVLAVVDSTVLASVEQAMARRFPRVTEVTYLNTGTWTEVLATPDPAVVQRVILIRNR